MKNKVGKKMKIQNEHGKTKMKLSRIEDLMENGQWEEAIRGLQKCNITARAFAGWLDNRPEEVARDFALLGFYARDFKPTKRTLED